MNELMNGYCHDLSSTQICQPRAQVGFHHQRRLQAFYRPKSPTHWADRPWCPHSLAMLMLASPHLPSSVSPAGFPEAQATAIDPLASSYLDEAERGGPGTLLGKG